MTFSQYWNMIQQVEVRIDVAKRRFAAGVDGPEIFYKEIKRLMSLKSKLILRADRELD